MKRLPIGILGSGKGSNCRAILERIRSDELAAEARVVISDVFDAPILDIAREFSVANAYLPPGQFRTRLEPEAEEELVKMLREAGVELVVLAGFMRVLITARSSRRVWYRFCLTIARKACMRGFKSPSASYTRQ